VIKCADGPRLQLIVRIFAVVEIREKDRSGKLRSRSEDSDVIR
jgi:hypothetical protein